MGEQDRSDWNDWAKYVLAEQKRQNQLLEQLQANYTKHCLEMAKELESLKVKVSFGAAIIAVVVSAALKFL